MNQFLVKPAHKTQFNAAHNAQNVVIDRIDADLGSLSATDGGGGKNQLQDGVVNSREVATAAGLMFLRAQGKGIHVDSSVRVTSVVLVRLHDVEVCTFAFRETVLAVQLQLSSDDRVLTPAVHVEGSLTEDESSGIRDGGTTGSIRIALSELVAIRATSSVPLSTRSRGNGRGSKDGVDGSGHLEETSGGLDEGVGTGSLGGASESMDSVGEGIHGVGVVEGLSTKGLVQGLTTLKRRAVVDVGIGLDNPDELLARMVEVELNLVAGRADRLVTSELELLNQILVGVLGELAALIGIQEDIVDVERRGNERLLVGARGRYRGTGSTSQRLDGPQALTNRAEIDVNLNFVILYESLIPPLSGYLSASMYRLTYYIHEHCRGLDYILSLH